jgi:hypothetical protein
VSNTPKYPRYADAQDLGIAEEPKVPITLSLNEADAATRGEHY